MKNIKVYKFDKKHYSQYMGNVISFLNEPVIGIYQNGYYSFREDYFCHKFMGDVLSVLIDIERTIKNTFCCGLDLKNINEHLFNDMFPKACELFKTAEGNYLENISNFLIVSRNLNAHAYTSKGRSIFIEKILNINFLEEKPLNSQISYLTEDNQLTVAGYIYLLLLFLRDQSIYELTQKNNVFAIVSCGEHRGDTGETFVREISKVNLELNISSRECTDLIEAATGISDVSNEEFSVLYGDQNFPIFSVKGNYKFKTLTIYKNSLSKTYYKKDYSLFIEDEKLFIDEANKLPPMVLVDVLYHLGLNKFNLPTLEMVKSKCSDLDKLNHPKFYVEKNIDILFAPSTNSDIKRNSTCINDNLIRVLLNLENKLMKFKNIKFHKYSILANVLRDYFVPDQLIKRVHALRAFAFHGYILNESIVLDSITYEYSVSFIVNTLSELMRCFEANCSQAFDELHDSISNNLLRNLLFSKYFLASKRAVDYLKNNDPIDLENLLKSNGRIENSCVDINLFTPLTYKRCLVYQVSIKNFDNKFYILDNPSNIKFLYEYADRNGLTIYVKESNLIEVKMEIK